MVDPLFISDTDLVRRLARNVVTNDFSDAQIVTEQKMAYAKIIIKTGKSDWSATDNRFPAIVKIEEQQAAAYILEHYGAGTPEELNMIGFLTTQVNELLDTVVEEGIDPESDTDVIIATSDYGSFPASYLDNPYSPESVPYRSTTEQL